MLNSYGYSKMLSRTTPQQINDSSYTVIPDENGAPFSKILQGVWTLSAQSNFDSMQTKFGQIWKIRIFSWFLMMQNLFQIIILGHSKTTFTPTKGS